MGDLAKAVCPWGLIVRVCSLASFPVRRLCYVFLVEDVFSQLPALAAGQAPPITNSPSETIKPK